MSATVNKDRPISFRGEMIRALLDGRKTQTRWVVEPQPEHTPGTDQCRLGGDGWWRWFTPLGGYRGDAARCPYGAPGDKLWVREAWAEIDDEYGTPIIAYRAGGHRVVGLMENGNLESFDGMIGEYEVEKWNSPFHMPRWASRITLEVLSVRVEQVQDIGKDGRKANDVLAEGVDPLAIERQAEWFHPDDCPSLAFKQLWDPINAKLGCGWDANPPCWVIEVKVVTP